MPGLFQNFGQNVRNSFQNLGSNFRQRFGLQPGQGMGRALGGLFGGLATGGLSTAGRYAQAMNAYQNQDQFSATSRPTADAGPSLMGPGSPSLEEQFRAMTGGMTIPAAGGAGMNNLQLLRHRTGEGELTGNLDPHNQELGNLIAGQFGLTPGRRFSPRDWLTNGQLDLTKVDRGLLGNLSPEAMTRMQGANVLGADLLTSLLTPKAPRR